jgi:hypothetical protein
LTSECAHPSEHLRRCDPVTFVHFDATRLVPTAVLCAYFVSQMSDDLSVSHKQ